jgi:hypothetical protein
MTAEIIMWGFGTIGLLIGIYIRMELKLKELDVRVQALEQTDKAMNAKLDRIIEAIHDVKLDLRDKQDRS